MREIHPINKLNNHRSIHESGTHILYIFNEIDRYIGNAVNFILEGLENNEVILFVDTEELIIKIKDLLKLKIFPPSHFQNIIFADSIQSYLTEDQFDVDKAGELISLLQPYFQKGYSIRTWGQVPVSKHECTLESLRLFECNSDDFIALSGLISVCAYNGLTTPAYVQNELMKTHTHFMTDNEYSLSPLYNREHLQIPSVEEKERLRRLEQQNKELRDQNNHLKCENNLVKQKNEMIVQNEQKIRIIIDQMPIPVIIRKRANILFLNSIAEEQFTIENQDFERTSYLQQFFGIYDKDSTVSNNEKVHEHQFSSKNGKMKYYLVKSVEMIFEGEPAILHSFVDITHEKENEKLMIRSEKMNIAGELAASIAHELRNPLTAIKGFFHMLKNTDGGNEWYYSIIEDELSRIEQISSELLSLAKPHSDNRRKHSIVQLVRDVKLLLTSQTNMKNIEMILQTDSEELYINCDDTKIKQVLINLIKNSIDAMNNGGKIVLRINEIRDNVQVQVIDQGSGIPKELMNRIGEPFYTTKEKGTGIGLMVCFQIIESHNGTIQVDSMVGVGTTFTLTLPVLRDA